MQALFDNVSVLLIFAFIGWTLGKTHILSSQNLKLLSVLLVWIFLPSKSFKSFSTHFTVAYFKEYYPLILVALLLISALVLLNYLFVPRFVKGTYQQNVVRYSLTIPSFAYVGYVLMENVYGELMLLNAQMFSIPQTLYTCTEGYRLLTNAGKPSFKNMITPSLVAMIVGSIFGITGLPLPNAINQVVTSSAACVGPISFILTGITISNYSLKSLLQIKGTYIISFLRLVVTPIAICLVLHLFCSREIVTVATLLYAMPCGLNTVVFPKMVGEDCKPGASLALISNIACLFTVPVCMQFMEYLYH